MTLVRRLWQRAALNMVEPRRLRVMALSKVVRNCSRLAFQRGRSLFDNSSSSPGPSKERMDRPQ